MTLGLVPGHFAQVASTICLAVTSTAYERLGSDTRAMPTKKPVPMGLLSSTSPCASAAYRKTTDFWTASTLMFMVASADAHKLRIAAKANLNNKILRRIGMLRNLYRREYAEFLFAPMPLNPFPLCPVVVVPPMSPNPPRFSYRLKRPQIL